MQDLRLMLSQQLRDDLEFVEHVVHDEIEIVGLLEGTVSYSDGNLGVDIESIEPQTHGEIVLVDPLIKKTAKLVL